MINRADMVAIYDDIAELNKAEKELQLRAELLDNASDAIFLHTIDGEFIYVNATACKSLGYTKDELLKLNLNEIAAPGIDIEAHRKLIINKGQAIFESAQSRKNGSVVPVEIKARIIEIDNNRLVLSAARDITERKQAEEALRRSEAKYRLLTEDMSDIVFTLDLNMKTTYVSPSIERILGFTPEERLSQPIEEQLTPASLQLAFVTLQREMEKERTTGEIADKLFTLELEYYHKDGTTRITEVTCKAIRDEQGKPIGIYGICRDITERKKTESELAKSYATLKKTLNDAIGTMSKIVEMRDPYTAGHQQRVAQLATAIAKELGFDDSKIEQLRMAVMVHDIGKIYVPSDILNKPGKLSELEFSIIKTHPQSGYDIVKNMDLPEVIAKSILQHHERLDGSGYPNGLTDKEIVIEAKILAVADVVEAIATHRPYRAALGIDKALEGISQNKGILYDEKVVEACMRLFKEKNFKFEKNP